MAGTKKGKLYATDVRRNANNEIWFRFSLREYATPKFEIYDVGGVLKKTLDLGQDLPPGEYCSRGRAYFWNREDGATPLANGVYFVTFYVDNVLQEVGKFTLTS